MFSLVVRIREDIFLHQEELQAPVGVCRREVSVLCSPYHVSETLLQLVAPPVLDSGTWDGIHLTAACAANTSGE